MARPNRPRPALTSASLDRLALRYVERFATTRAKLAAYLERKIRERGWEEGAPRADTAAIAERFAELGYVDDRAFAEAKAGALTRRGLGKRRVDQALRFAGVGAEDAEAVAPAVEAEATGSALSFARRKRIGPFGNETPDRQARERQVAAMVRAGHAPSLAWKIARMEPGDDPETMLAQD
jgi:regulatory protein